MWLHVGVVGTEKFFDAFNGNALNIVDNGITAVIALAGVTLAVFVGEHRTSCTHHCWRCEVFTCNELQTRDLTLELVVDERENNVFAFEF